MKLKLALATATAMGLLMGASHAGGNNNAEVHQSGGSNTAAVDQNAGDLNRTYISQNGDRNAASVTQDGDENRAGIDDASIPDDKTATPHGYNHRMRQIGNDNSIDIDQTGSANEIAFGAGEKGVLQQGSFNKITVDQDSGSNLAETVNGNEIRTIRQTSLDGQAATTNELTVIQNGGASPTNLINHNVGRINQDHTGGAANTISITQTGDSDVAAGDQGNDVWTVVQRQGGAGASGNTAMISQDGRYNTVGAPAVTYIGVDQRGKNNALTLTQTGSGNVVRSTSQIADAGVINTATVTQNGTGNYVLQVYQNTNTGGIGPNTITATFNGSGNGSGGLVSNRAVIGGLTGFAATAGAADSAFIQTDGGNNVMTYTATGDDNQFGLRQMVGSGNQITGTVTGSGNAAGVTHIGSIGLPASNNVTDFVQDGSGNNLGVYLNGAGNGAGVFTDAAAIGLTNGSIQQLGDDNDARYRASFGDGASNSNNNKYAIKQDGSGNQATGEVNGGDGNQLAVLQDGNDNLTTVSQNGGGNIVGVSITGDLNGGGALAGAAGTLAGLNGLTSGMITQDGFDNSAGLTITGDGLNQFAFLQDGNDNVIVGNVSGAGSNSATMVQIGSNNTSNFSQSGGGNMVSVNQ